MIRVVIAVALLAGALLTTASAQTGRSQLPSLALESLAGRDSFDRACASCHGAGGVGDGPVATALRTRPADLTVLSRRNGGSFPKQRVASFIEGTARASTHGSSEMPVWGTIFRGLETSAARVRVRIDNLVSYVESLQVPVDQSADRVAAVSPITGAQLFRTYCATCHGESARGNGPVNSQLRTPAPDLVMYTARNGGTFPKERVRQMIEGSGPAAHGDRTMPVWGDVFRRQTGAQDADAAARIDALVVFLQSIQQRGAE